MVETALTPITISVLLVVRNEAGCVVDCMESLLHQEFPAEQYEIIVVDGMSSDGTREKIHEVVNRHPGRSIRFLDNPKRILSSGWNIGIHAARGRYVIRPDAHTHVPADFLAANLRVMQSHPECAAVGGVIQTVCQGFVGRTIAAALSSRFGVGGSRFRVGGSPGVSEVAAFALYRRDVLVGAGGFDESLLRNQDVACHSQIRAQGGVLYFDPSIQSTYLCRSTIPGIAKQMYLNGHWLPLLSRHGISGRISPRYFVPLGFVVVLLVLGTLGTIHPWARWVLAGVLLVYLTAAASFAIQAPLAIRHRILFPVVTFVMHVSYGLGWLTGLLRLPLYRPVRRNN